MKTTEPIRPEDLTPEELDLYRAAADHWRSQPPEQILREVAILFHLGVHLAR